MEQVDSKYLIIPKLAVIRIWYHRLFLLSFLLAAAPYTNAKVSISNTILLPPTD
jgi:hypothetical protein